MKSRDRIVQPDAVLELRTARRRLFLEREIDIRRGARGHTLEVVPSTICPGASRRDGRRSDGARSIRLTSPDRPLESEEDHERGLRRSELGPEHVEAQRLAESPAHLQREPRNPAHVGRVRDAPQQAGHAP